MFVYLNVPYDTYIGDDAMGILAVIVAGMFFVGLKLLLRKVGIIGNKKLIPAVKEATKTTKEISASTTATIKDSPVKESRIVDTLKDVFSIGLAFAILFGTISIFYYHPIILVLTFVTVIGVAVFMIDDI